MPKILVLTTDGQVTAHDMPEDFTAFCQEHIGCALAGVLRLDKRIDMWFDDDGTDIQPEPNFMATVFRVASGLGDQMVMGPVVLATYDDEGGTEPLDAGQMLHLMLIAAEAARAAEEAYAESLN